MSVAQSCPSVGLLTCSGTTTSRVLRVLSSMKGWVGEQGGEAGGKSEKHDGMG